MIPIATAAAAAGKAVVARRERLGHEPKPAVEHLPHFPSEAKQYRARAANEVHAINFTRPHAVEKGNHFRVGVSVACPPRASSAPA